jgi:hypothetical protein
MKRSEVFAWLQAHGGQKGIANIKIEQVKNPAYNPDTPAGAKQPEYVRKKTVTWTSNDGRTLSVVDPTSEANEGDNPDQEMRPADPTVEGPGIVRDPEYLAPQEGFEPKDPSMPVQTPYQEAQSQTELAQAQANASKGLGFHTDDQLAVLARQKDADARAALESQFQQANQERADRQETRQTAADERQAKAQEASNLISQGNLTLAQTKEAREAATANRPQVISQANTDNPTIAMFDPTTGGITSVTNPNYDAIKVEAQRKREELGLAIQVNQMTAQQATQAYNQWFQENVQAPLMIAQEARATVADQRAAMQAEEQRNQFSADFGLRKATFGEEAGQHAAQNEISLLPYRVGGSFGKEMPAAINSLAHGGVVGGPSPSAGINFSPGAFSFKKPDFQKIAAKATAAALSHLSPYIPTEGSFPAASSQGMPRPNFANAPKPTTGPIDLTPLIQGAIKSYAGPAAAPPPPPPDDQQQPAP